MDNDVFRFFFEAGSGIALAVLMFGVLPFYGARSLVRSIKEFIHIRKNRGTHYVGKNVQKG
ncbi:hypothetical protein [Brevibacillus formosus]|uniref:hypothetical protein n=1 Tax=Brevibacillus formosus TaxID=54913 RepID=UPI003F1A67F4